jgi:hypothetical protein
VTARPGFATLAVALMLAVAGGLALMVEFAPGAPTLLADTRETHHRMTRIGRALSAHGARVGRLPCPALDATGLEGPCVATESAAVGFVPWVALGIPEGQTRDAWGRLLTYAVSPSLTVAGTWVGGAVGSLSLAAGAAADGSGDPARLDTDLPWVLVSHGANGLGAGLPSGSRLAPPDGAGEIANLGRAPDTSPAVFRAAPHGRDRSQSDGFDDLVEIGVFP